MPLAKWAMWRRIIEPPVQAKHLSWVLGSSQPAIPTVSHSAVFQGLIFPSVRNRSNYPSIVVYVRPILTSSLDCYLRLPRCFSLCATGINVKTKEDKMATAAADTIAIAVVEVMAATDVVITPTTTGGGITIAIAFADGDDNYVAAGNSTAATGAATHEVTSFAAAGANNNRGPGMGGVTVNKDRGAAGAANNNTPAAAAANASSAATCARKGRKRQVEERGTSEAVGRGTRQGRRGEREGTTAFRT